MRAPEGDVVLVDMDNVLADFDKEVLTGMAKRSSGLYAPVSRTNVRIADDYPDIYDEVEEISNEEGFFRRLPLVEDALTGWQRIIDLGYLPRICSSPKIASLNCETEKLDWLDEHFGPRFGSWVVEQAIITREKHEHDGIALIDDKPEISSAHEATWRHIIFDRPFNEGAKGPRLHGWLDPNLSALIKSAAIDYHTK